MVGDAEVVWKQLLQKTISHLNIAAATAEGCMEMAIVWFDTAHCWGAADNWQMDCKKKKNTQIIVPTVS